MDRKQILTALDSLDDATHHLQATFIACGDPDFLDLLPQVYIVTSRSAPSSTPVSRASSTFWTWWAATSRTGKSHSRPYGRPNTAFG